MRLVHVVAWPDTSIEVKKLHITVHDLNPTPHIVSPLPRGQNPCTYTALESKGLKRVKGMTL